MKLLGYKEHWINNTVGWINEINDVEVDGVDRWIRKILTNAKPECSDHIAALRFTHALAINSFTEIELEPFDSGPDIKAKWNSKFIYFEVTRRRPEVDEWAPNFDLNSLPLEKAENIISKIQAKNRQLLIRELNIIVLWSDTWQVQMPNIEEAFRYIEREITQNRGTYNKLSGILFTTGGITQTSKTLKQFHLIKNDNALKPVGIRLSKKLESLHERDVRKLQREWKELAAAMRRLDS